MVIDASALLAILLDDFSKTDVPRVIALPIPEV
jgi:PIN domain nuclease of toxin-antitoxin system